MSTINYQIMIKHIFKIIWAQRKSNGWILGELVIVMCALWFMMDKLWVDVRCYNAPMGYDISNTWRFKLSTLSSNAPGYVPDSLYDSNATQDLLKLMERIRQEQEVEEVCVTYWSMPYSNGSSWGTLLPLGADTSKAVGQNYHKLKVSPSYFDVFRMKDKEGRAITPLVENAYRPLVITAEAEDFFFGGQSAIGRQISENDDLSEPFTIAAVLPTFRSNDFDRPENCAFTILKGESLQEFVKNFGVRSAELSVRTKRPMTEDEMYAFLEKTADRMTVNNTFVHGVTLLADQRDDQLRFTKNENSKKLSMMAFLLVNVFFGIVGTFWLRTERRRSEIGLRMAMGATRKGIFWQLVKEGLALLTIAFIPSAVIFANLLHMEVTQGSEIPPDMASRLLFGFVFSYAVMAAMIVVGISFPSYRAMRMHPADALRQE